MKIRQICAKGVYASVFQNYELVTDKRPGGLILMKVSLVEGKVPGSKEVRVEAGETVPGRTDGQVGEVQV